MTLNFAVFELRKMAHLLPVYANFGFYAFLELRVCTGQTDARMDLQYP